jgi:hypothetical protein
VTGAESHGLAAVAEGFRRDESSAAELAAAFVDAVVFCRREEYVGFSAVGDEGAGYIPMYSSETTLVEGEGPCDWFAAQGGDMLLLVPEGYGVVLDHGTAGEVWLAASAISRETVAKV